MLKPAESSKKKKTPCVGDRYRQTDGSRGVGATSVRISGKGQLFTRRFFLLNEMFEMRGGGRGKSNFADRTSY